MLRNFYNILAIYTVPLHLVETCTVHFGREVGSGDIPGRIISGGFKCGAWVYPHRRKLNLMLPPEPPHENSTSAV